MSWSRRGDVICHFLVGGPGARNLRDEVLIRWLADFRWLDKSDAGCANRFDSLWPNAFDMVWANSLDMLLLEFCKDASSLGSDRDKVRKDGKSDGLLNKLGGSNTLHGVMVEICRIASLEGFRVRDENVARGHLMENLLLVVLRKQVGIILLGAKASDEGAKASDEEWDAHGGCEGKSSREIPYKRSDVWRQKCSREYDFVGCELPS